MMDTPQLQDTFSPEKKFSRIRKASVATGAAVATGVSGYVAYRNGLDYDTVHSAVNTVVNAKITPKIEVYDEAVDGMVLANETLRAGAIPTMIAALGVLAIEKAKSVFKADYEDYEMAKQDYAGTESFTDHKRKGLYGKVRGSLAGLGLASTTVLLTGGSSGLEHEISNGPERPVTQAFDLLSNNSDAQRHIILQSPRNSFMDDSNVRERDLAAFKERAAKAGVRVELFNESLPNVDNQPGLLFTIPDQLFSQVTGEQIDKNCETAPIMLGDASEKRVGETVEVNGTEAHVVRKLEDVDQMNRNVAVVAESDADCIENQDSETTFGAIVSGGEAGEAQELFENDPLSDDAAMITEQEFNDNNRDFWRKNGTPLVLQLMIYTGALSAIAIGNERKSNMQRNIKQIATLRAMGVKSKKIRKIERLRAIRNTAKATAVGGALIPGIALAFNTFVTGMRIGVGLKEVAVGGAITLAGNLYGNRRAAKKLEKLDLEQTLKG